MGEQVLKALANPTNQAILSLLAIEPTYPRRISELLSLSESDVSRRLRRMEEAGLVRSGWEHVDGKNVKSYRLVAEEITVAISGEGLSIETAGDDGEPTTRTVVDRLEVRVPEPEGFVGRERELEILDGPDPVVAVEGIAGIGKTSLAAAFARHKQQTAPVFFHSFSGTESLTWLAHRLGVFQARQGDEALLAAIETGAPMADQRELMLEALDQEGSVAVFDAVERVRDEALEAFVSDAIERVDQGRLVVTGRRLPSFDPTDGDVRRVRLTGLTPEEVHRFLDERGLDVDPKTAESVQQRLGGHPLATNLFAEAAAEATSPVDELLGRVPDDEIEDYLLAEVNDTLSEPEQNVLAHASIFHGPFTRSAIETVYPGDPGGALVKLRRRRLLRADGDVYHVHSLLRSFFAERLDDAARLHEAAAEHALSQGTLEARLDALYHLLEAGQRSRVLDLLERDLDLEEFDLIEEGYHNLYLDVLQRLDPDEILDDAGAGLVEDELGDIRYHRGEHEQALSRYRRAAERFSGADADAGERLADLAWKRALVLAELGREDEAVEQVRAGLDEHTPDERTQERLEALADELGVEP